MRPCCLRHTDGKTPEKAEGHEGYAGENTQGYERVRVAVSCRRNNCYIISACILKLMICKEWHSAIHGLLQRILPKRSVVSCDHTVHLKSYLNGVFSPVIEHTIPLKSYLNGVLSPVIEHTIPLKSYLNGVLSPVIEHTIPLKSYLNGVLSPVIEHTILLYKVAKCVWSIS